MSELTKLKPLLRGRFHEGAGFVSLGACILLLVRCEDGLSLVAALVYSLSLIALFTISALYHRIYWHGKKWDLMRRLDHAAIFGLIAGTSTAVFLLAIPPEKRIQPLVLVWAVTIIGMLQVLFWTRAPRWLASSIYVLAGWLALPYISEISNGVGPVGVVLLVIGGLIYTGGAVVYALKKPNPNPKIFGYHEIFHICVILAAAVHFVVIYRLVCGIV